MNQYLMNWPIEPENAINTERQDRERLLIIYIYIYEYISQSEAYPLQNRRL